jgi:hypothetical protein
MPRPKTRGRHIGPRSYAKHHDLLVPPALSARSWTGTTMTPDELAKLGVPGEAKVRVKTRASFSPDDADACVLTGRCAASWKRINDRTNADRSREARIELQLTKKRPTQIELGGFKWRAHLPADWRDRRARVLARDGHRCTIAGPRCTGLATEVDHIGDRDDHRELMLRSACHACHMARTQT